MGVADTFPHCFLTRRIRAFRESLHTTGELPFHRLPTDAVRGLRQAPSFRRETLFIGELRLTLVLDVTSGHLREVILPLEVPRELSLDSLREAVAVLSEYSLPEKPDPRAAAFAMELACIPEGETRTYADLALATGSSPRGIGSRCASNRLLLRMPCHRVVSGNGIGGYRSGVEWKKALLRLEAGG